MVSIPTINNNIKNKWAMDLTEMRVVIFIIILFYYLLYRFE